MDWMRSALTTQAILYHVNSRHRLGGSIGETPGLAAGLPSPRLGADLIPFGNNGTVPLSRINDAAMRLLTPWFLFGQNKANLPAVPNSINVNTKQAQAHIRKAAAQSTVLLKNSGVLPLCKPKHIAGFGIDGEIHSSHPRTGV